MSTADLLRYIVLILVCLSALGVIAYVIRKAIREGNAASLMRDIAGTVMEIKAAADARKVEAKEGREAALKAVQAKFVQEVDRLDEKQKKEAEYL